jgi:hypothetical protein
MNGIPALGLLGASILANVVQVTPGAIGGNALRINVTLGSIDNFISAMFLAGPFMVTIMHYTAALHAKSICDQMSEMLLDNNHELSFFWL